MAVTVTGQVANSHVAEISITITMPIVDWDRIVAALREQMKTAAGGSGSTYPQWKVLAAISSVLARVREKVTDAMEVPD